MKTLEAEVTVLEQSPSAPTSKPSSVASSLAEHEKQAVVDEAHALFDRWYPQFDKCNRCVHLAHCTAIVLQRRGILAVVHAGSASWLCGEQTAFDGNSFGYEFNIDEATVRLMRGLPPELHAWTYLPLTREIIDLSLRHLPEQAKQLNNVDWAPEFLPPDFLWVALADRHHPYWLTRCVYESNRVAVAYVHQYAIGNLHIAPKVVSPPCRG